MIKRGLLFRLWLVLSIVWALLFGYRALAAWQAWDNAQLNFERAQVEAFAEHLFDDKGIGSYPGASEATTEERDRAFDNRKDAESQFYYAILLLFVGPAALGATLHIGRWIVAGSQTAKS